MSKSWLSNHNLNITWPLAQDAQSVMAQPDTWEKKNILWEENPINYHLQIYNLQESPAKWKDYSVEFIKNVSWREKLYSKQLCLHKWLNQSFILQLVFLRTLEC